MRTEEVERAIGRFIYIKDFSKKTGINYALETEDLTYLVTTLNYISKLEKKIKKLENQDEKDFTSIYLYAVNEYKQKIRDKIKELEENRDKYVEENKFGSYIEVEGKIEVLKEILGE